MRDSRRFVIVLVLALGLSACVSKDTYNAQVLRTNNFQRLLSEEEKRSVEFSADIVRLKEQIASLEAKNKTLTAQLNEAKAQVVRSLEEVGRLQDEGKHGRAFGGFSSAPTPAAAPEPALRGPSQEPPDRLGELQESDPVLRDVEKKFEKKKGKPAAQAKAPKQAKAPLPPLAPEEASPAPPPPPAKVRVQKPNEVPSPPPLPAADVVPPAPVQPAPLPPPAPVRMQKLSKVSPPEPEVVLPAPVQASPPPAKLQARASVPPPAQPAAPPSDSFFRYHQVQKGETLDAIAKRYKTDAQTLRELNDLAVNEGVRPGDRIIVGQK